MLTAWVDGSIIGECINNWPSDERLATPVNGKRRDVLIRVKVMRLQLVFGNKGDLQTVVFARNKAS